MTEHRIFTMKFSSVYPAYVNKATWKQRTQQEVDQLTLSRLRAVLAWHRRTPT